MTKKTWWVATSSALACLMLVSGASARAADDEKGKAIESKGEEKAAAATVDFAAELELDFASLKSLGLRIDQARSAPDPVGLASAARDLAVAEKTSGKTAKIKSSELAKEAVTMAKRRNRPAELKALALMTRDSKAAKALAEQAAKAQKEIDDRKDGEKTRGIEGRLFVTNKTRFYVKIYVDYRLVGTVDPFSVATMYVGAAPFTDTILYGEAPGTTLIWPATRITERVRNYTWTLN